MTKIKGYLGEIVALLLAVCFLVIEDRLIKNEGSTFYLYLYAIIIITIVMVGIAIRKKYSNCGLLCGGVVLIISLVGVLNAKDYFFETSNVPMSAFENEIDIYSTEDWILDKAKDGMLGSEIVLFNDIILYSLLCEKEVAVEEEIIEDGRIARVLNNIENEIYQNLGTIDKKTVGMYQEDYHPQLVEYFMTDQTVKKMYIVAGTRWETDEVIYIVPDVNSDVWLIPQRLLHGEFKTGIEGDNSNFKLLATSEIEKANYSYVRNRTMDNILGLPETNNIHFIGNVAYMLILLLLGGVVLSVWKKQLEGWIIVLAALPMGCILEISLVFIMGVTRFPINKYTLFGGIALIIILSLLYSRKKCGLSVEQNRDKSIAEIILLEIILMAILYFSVNPTSFLSYDSVENILFARYIALNGSWGGLFAKVSSYSLFLPLLHVGASLLNVKMLYALVPVLTINLLLLVVGVLLKNHIGNDNKYKRVIFVIIAAGTMLATPMFAINAMWMLNNLSIGMYTAAAIALILYGKAKSCSSYYYLALPLFILANSVRIEGPIFGALVLAVLYNYLDKKIVQMYINCLSIVTTILFVIHIFSDNSGTQDFWTVGKGTMVLLVVYGVNLVISVYEKMPVLIRNMYEHIEQLLIIALLGAGLIIACIKTERFMHNLNAFSTVMFEGGLYGCFWGIVLFLVALAGKIGIKYSKEYGALCNMVVIYVLAIFDLMVLRTQELHTSYTDSAARMLLHIMPVAMILIYYFITEQSRVEMITVKSQEK